MIEEVPDIDYGHIGGLDKELDKVKDAVELPFLYPDLFAEHHLSPRKGSFSMALQVAERH